MAAIPRLVVDASAIRDDGSIIPVGAVDLTAGISAILARTPSSAARWMTGHPLYVADIVSDLPDEARHFAYKGHLTLVGFRDRLSTFVAEAGNRSENLALIVAVLERVRRARSARRDREREAARARGCCLALMQTGPLPR